MIKNYRNPVVRGLNPDPSICRVGDDFYLATSTMTLYPGVPIHHSRDLVNWRLIGHCLTRQAHFQLDKLTRPPMIYAPTLRYHDGTFYMITTNVHGGGNFFITARDPAGPWSDPIFVDADVFDPSLFFDDDGKVYYLRRGPHTTRDVIQAEIDIKTGKLLTPFKSLGVGMVSDDAEGPHLYKIDGRYYLLQAEGGSRYLHMATIGRGDSPWGPFEPCPHNPIISQLHAWWHPVRSAGHADLVQAGDGSWWAVFLATRHGGYDQYSQLGRETFLAPVEWRDGWPVVSVPATRQLTVPCERLLPEHPWPPEPACDDFDTPSLNLHWTFLGLPGGDFYSLSARPGYLRLWGQPGDLDDVRHAAFVGRRPHDLAFECGTGIDFTPATDNEEAGLSVHQRHDFRYDLLVTRRQGARCVVLRKRVGDMTTETVPAPVAPGPVNLRVTADAEKMKFQYADSHEPDRWVDVGSGMTQLLSTEIIGSWGGLLLGLCALGNGSHSMTPADFDWFKYVGKEA